MLAVPENEKGGRAVNPVIGIDFEANWSTESTPPDNSMAISNGGFIITANNDGVEYYNSSGTFLYFDFWSDFFNDNSLTASIYDPKVIYDSGADRFVLVLLHGSNANTPRMGGGLTRSPAIHSTITAGLIIPPSVFQIMKSISPEISLPAIHLINPLFTRFQKLPVMQARVWTGNTGPD